MRMHTIPQNVTAYEDRIVGMLVGRQFIYLAVGGVVIFVLLSTNVGPFLVRAFLSLLVGGFAAALALFKPNDRNLDGLVLSYAQAIFGPTEWVWLKDEMPIEKLRLITDQLAGRPPVVNQGMPNQRSNQGQDNLLRVSRFQTFISERESGMDNEELEFVEQLNFSEPVPQRVFAAADSTEKAPPMLTKQNYTQLKPAPAPAAAPLPPQNQPKPISPLAGRSSQLGATVTIEGRQQGVQLRSNLRTNRSLSRQLLSSGVITLPVRGERQFDLSDDLKNELKEITSYMQHPGEKQTTPAKLVSGEPVTATAQAAPNKTQPIAAPPTPVAPKPSPVQDSAKQSERVSRFSDYDSSNSPSISQQIAMLGQALPNSGITKGNSMSDFNSTNSSTPSTDNSAAQPQTDPTYWS